MLRIYTRENDHLTPAPSVIEPELVTAAVWLDLKSPTYDESKSAEDMFGIAVPTRDEMEEIELSARLYQEDGAQFMTMTALTNLDGDHPVKTPITFILKGTTLVSVRHAESRPFDAFTVRVQRANGTAASSVSGELVMIGLIEALIDRMADTLERLANEIDTISREVFRNKASNANKKTRDLQTLIEQIGRKGDFLTMVRESLVSISRLVAYHSAIETGKRKIAKEARARIKLIQRDASSLGEHSTFMSSKINFLLDATLGLINLEQNQIIKIFTVASVIFLPPTLVASIYGMNFDIMPELRWGAGYPWAIVLMILSSALPFYYFKRRGWL